MLDNDAEKIYALILASSPELTEGAKRVYAFSGENREAKEPHFVFFTVLLAG